MAKFSIVIGCPNWFVKKAAAKPLANIISSLVNGDPTTVNGMTPTLKRTFLFSIRRYKGAAKCLPVTEILRRTIGHHWFRKSLCTECCIQKWLYLKNLRNDCQHVIANSKPYSVSELLLLVYCNWLRGSNGQLIAIGCC